MKSFIQKIYNPLNFEEYREVDTNIPIELVKTIQNSLKIINTEFICSAPVVIKDNNIYFFLLLKKMIMDYL